MLLQSAKADDIETFFGLFHAADDTQRAFLDAMKPFAEKWGRLDKACKAKFGAGLDNVAVGQQRMSRGLSADQFKNLTAADFQVEESGGTATASHPGLQQPMRLVRVDGVWKLDIAAALGQMQGAAANPAAIKQMGGLMGKLGDSLDQLAADVQSGKLASVQALQQALMQKFAEAMMSGAVRPPGGG
jgi:hypothetical protein